MLVMKGVLVYSGRESYNIAYSLGTFSLEKAYTSSTDDDCRLAFYLTVNPDKRQQARRRYLAQLSQNSLLLLEIPTTKKYDDGFAYLFVN